MNDAPDDGRIYLKPRLQASIALLVSMLSHPAHATIPLETDRCPQCQNWLDAGWMAIAGSPEATGSLRRYVVAVFCGGCAFEADTQHFMNRYA